jgi:hypothetical protein
MSFRNERKILPERIEYHREIGQSQIQQPGEREERERGERERERMGPLSVVSRTESRSK